jgi:hypothetical protein
MIVHDSNAEVEPPWIYSDLLYGVSYNWCMLHNFLADFKMCGRLDVVAAEQAATIGLLPRPSWGLVPPWSPPSALQLGVVPRCPCGSHDLHRQPSVQ